MGQFDSTAKFGIGESVGHQSEVLEDDYGIAVIPDHFIDIVSGVDPSKFAGGTGRIGEDVLRRGFGFGVVGGAGDPTTGGGKSKKKRGSNPLGDVSENCRFLFNTTVLEFAGNCPKVRVAYPSRTCKTIG